MFYKNKGSVCRSISLFVNKLRLKTWICRQIVTSQTAHTKYKWPPSATEGTPPQWKFSVYATAQQIFHRRTSMSFYNVSHFYVCGIGSWEFWQTAPANTIDYCIYNQPLLEQNRTIHSKLHAAFVHPLEIVILKLCFYQCVIHDVYFKSSAFVKSVELL